MNLREIGNVFKDFRSNAYMQVQMPIAPRDINRDRDHPSKRKRSDLTPDQKTETNGDKFVAVMENVPKELNRLHIV